MRFSKIAITAKGVHLVTQTKSEAGAIEWKELESPEGARKSFANAVQKFKDYVVSVMPFLGAEDVTVSTINLSESKNGLRGLQVSVSVALEDVNNKVTSITTPLVHEAGESTSDEAFTLDGAVMKLIKLVEAEAAKYWDGDREQVEMFAEESTSENTKAFSDRSAAAEVASTRKPRARKAKPAADGAFAPALVQ